MRSILSVSSVLVFLVGCGGSGGSDTSVSKTSMLHSVSATPITSAVEDQPYAFTVAVNNPNGEVLTYSLQNAPSWLSIDNKGVVSGTAQTDADTGTFKDISVSVSDSQQRTVALAPFNLTVKPVNDAPIIEFSEQRYAVDGRSSTLLSFNFNDEESAYPGNVQVAGASSTTFAVELTSDNQVEVTVADVESVTHENLQIEFLDGNTSVIKEVPFTIYPVTQSGLGRTLRGSRNGHGIHLVILGDGYVASEETMFMQDAKVFNGLFDKDPDIAMHMSAWNIHMVFRASDESGADEFHGVDTTDTFFEAGYSCADIQRLICANTSKVFATALEEFPQASQTVLVVNSDIFGGSGSNSVAVYNRTSPELAMHELGHSFANLADEYVDESIADYYAQFYQQGVFANVSNSSNPADAPWAHWIEDLNNVANQAEQETVGLYEGAFFNAEGYYRPVYDSAMRTAGQPFGPVNAEQWILSIYEEVGAVTEMFPLESAVNVDANKGARFSITPTFGTSLQEVRWFIDGVEVTENKNQTALFLDLPVGSYQVEMRITDVSGKVRNPAKDISANFSYQWQLAVN